VFGAGQSDGRLSGRMLAYIFRTLSGPI
jgi:hypothetical protein